uniref:G3BP stress granule assembly factor 2a n=1 Tax=Dicentrarchus labrax TaxID=13489 RepID=A0A8P4GEF9_DICLA
MVMEKPSPLLVGREFVRQYYTLLNKAPDFLHRFYGRNSSYVHGGLDPSGKLAEAVYGQAEIHKKVMSLQFSECHTKIRHVDAHATLSDGVVVQVLGELSNNGQPMRKFMQTFVLAPEGSVANKFYVHNDIFRYEDEVFGDSEAELDEGKMVTNILYRPCFLVVGCLVKSVLLKNLPPTGTVTTSGISPHVVKAPSSQPRVEAKPETQTAPLRPRDQRTRDRPSFTPRGPRPDGVASSESQTGKPHLSFVNKGGRGDAESGDMDSRRIVRYPDSHQLFVGNLPHDIDESELKEFFMTYGNVVELRINTKGVGGKLPNFGFVVFDDSDPVQRILGAKPIMFRGEVRLNVEEKKTRAVRERETRGGGDERRDMRRNDRGPGGSRGIVGSGMMRERDGRGPPPRGGMAPKPGMGSGRGSGGQGEGRFTTQRR